MKTIVVPIEFKVNRGGVPQSAISLISGLAELDLYRLVVVCPRDSEISSCHFPEGVIVITSKASDWGLSKQHVLSSIFVSLDIYRKLKRYVDEDTLFLTNHVGASYMVSLMPFRNLKEIYVNRGGNFDSYSPLTLLMKYKLRFNKFSYVVATSEKQRFVLINEGFPQERICVIHNGLPLPQKEYHYRSLDSSLLRISTMGFLSDLKGQHIGVQLIKMLRERGINAVLNLYGAPGADVGYNDYLKRVIKDTEMMEFVYFKGFVGGEPLFSETDILISFSKSEGFGRSIVEGMLRKIPVIAYRGAGGPVDITNDGKFGHLVGENIARAYLEVILYMIDNPEYNKNNVMESYEYACRMFTEGVMVNKYAAMFENYYNHGLF